MRTSSRVGSVFALAIFLGGCLGASAREASFSNGPGNGDSGPVGRLAPDSRIWGVTVTDPFNLDSTVLSLSQLSQRVTARVVFDEGQRASTYLQLVPRIHAAADVMGEILDSRFVSMVSVDEYIARTQEYVDALGDNVDIWEVGNEMNGEWAGTTEDVVAKLRGAYDLVKQRGRRAALTLYYNRQCFDFPDHEMFTWASQNIPDDIKAGLDWVLVSYYEDDCEGYQPDWQLEFSRLAAMFPNSQLGIGECGTVFEERKSEYLTRYYSMRIDQPRYIGGYFWWYFNQDMVPWTQPLWTTLNDLLRAF